MRAFATDHEPIDWGRRALVFLLAAAAVFAAGELALAPAPAAAMSDEDPEVNPLCSELLWSWEVCLAEEEDGSGGGSSGGASSGDDSDEGCVCSEDDGLDEDDEPYRGTVPNGEEAEEIFEGPLSERELIELGVLEPEPEHEQGLGSDMAPKQTEQLENEVREGNWLKPECVAIWGEMTLARGWNEASELPDYSLTDAMENEYMRCLNKGMRRPGPAGPSRRFGIRPQEHGPRPAMPRESKRRAAKHKSARSGRSASQHRG